MKKIFFIVTLLVSSYSITTAQTIERNWEFTSLFATTDTIGETHLFYTLTDYTKYVCFDVWGSRLRNDSDNDFRHLNTTTQADSTFIQNWNGIGGIGCSYYDGWVNIENFHPFDGNLEHFIFVGSAGDGFEPYGYVQVGHQYYFAPLFHFFGEVYANPHLGNSFFITLDDRTVQLPITSNRDTLNYIENYWYDIYDDKSDSIIYVHDFALSGLSSFDDSLSFYSRGDTVFRSENFGITEDPIPLPLRTQFIFDVDSLHIFAISASDKVFISNNYGKPDSWSELSTPGRATTFQIDPNQSGVIFIADSMSIYKSTDYGTSFQVVHKHDQYIRDFYHKPDSEVYYIMQKDKIVEINPDSTITLKASPSIPSFDIDTDLFPYQDGNEFVFTVRKKDPEDNDEFYNMIDIEEFKTTVHTTKTENGMLISFQDSAINPLFNTLLLDSSSNVLALDWKEQGDWTLIPGHKQFYEAWLPIPASDTLTIKGNYGGTSRTYINNRSFDTGVSIVFYAEKTNDYGPYFDDLIASAQWSDTVGITNLSFGVNGLHYYLKGATIGSTVYGDMMVRDIVPLDTKPELPNQLVLHQNYPNPFNPSTAISYELSANSHVSLKVYDLLGREVAELVNTQQAAGMHEVTFDASSLSSGMYLYRIEANGAVQTKRFTLIK